MAGIAYHGAAHIGCGKGNFCRKAGAIGMITTNGQVRRSRLFGQLPGKNKLKAGSRLLG